MPIINNQKLYENAKKIADEIYDKPSAYKSGFIVKKYKELGGTYNDDDNEKSLKRWFKEKWKDIGNGKYPVYRPTLKISEKTPLLEDEIDLDNLKEQIRLKQILRENQNLPKFKQKEKEKDIYEIKNYSQIQAKKLGVIIKPSNKKNKKIDIYDMNNNYILSIGDKNYSDYATYILNNGKDYADKRRKLYKIRHNKNRKKPNTASYYADNILW